MSSVSVVIPCYAYGRFLEDAVASVLEDQPGVDVRVLVIDDASPDDSAEVAARIAARDPRVEVRLHRENKGNIATFNEGLMEWADGDYCTLLSADDLAAPGSLRRACDLLDAHPEVGFVYGRAAWFTDGVPTPPARTHLRGESVIRGREWLEHRFRQGENQLTTPEVVVRTSLQHRLGGYDPNLPKAADMELFMRFAAHADVGFLRGVDQALHRRHGTNMSTGVDPLADLVQRRAVFEQVLERYGHRLSGVRNLSTTVHRQLAREALWTAGREYDRGALTRTAAGRVLLRSTGTGTAEERTELLAFAADCWPEVKRFPLYRTLEGGHRLGARDIAFMVRERGRWWARRRAWTHRGY
ncbi:glycosyltransferase family A protein [Phycicoccus sp. M110.8]|uniref:glycosyltransferase family 2 protein n=1 Tax=Phycicoccus sp. M110.8 TaxID=3075433 RepID=UPI0028FD9D02|nr:glycosyltransferase family A protein [Phycicoccus sp. M110.8]MDU0313012.1 glycosyltransferase family A protein [Phycicoccus sp. M110.8]